eukprot:jgi/Hompol1/6676/HPOL_000133-RA
MHALLARAASGDAVWSCRVPTARRSPAAGDFTIVPIHLRGSLSSSASSSSSSRSGVRLRFNTHVNLVFHIMDGFFLGGAGYSLNDHEVPVSKHDYLTIAGPIRWFVGHTFDLHEPTIDVDGLLSGNKLPLVAQGNGRSHQLPDAAKPVHVHKLPRAADLRNAVRPDIATMAVLVSIVLTIAVCGTVYIFYLKPSVIANEQNAAKKRK